MQCHICGALLNEGTIRCPSCGATAQSEASNSPYELQEEVIPFIDYPARRTTATTGAAVKQAAPFLHGAPQVPASSLTVPADTSSSPLTPQQRVEEERLPRRSISAGLAALFVILAFLLVGGGGFGYYLAKVQPVQLNNQATAVVQHILTAQAQATAKAIAALTSKSPQDIYNQVTSRTPDMSDPLSEQDGNFWISFHTPTIACFFSQGVYRTLDTEGPSYNLCPATKSNFSNFAYQIQMRLLRGDGCGLLFRMDIKHNAYYRLVFLKTGQYSLYVNNYDQSTSRIATGLSNTIALTLSRLPSPSLTATIIAFESNIYLYINGKFLTSIHNNTVTSGAIGISSLSETIPTEATYSDATVWNL